jgi:hypothetical protein
MPAMPMADSKPPMVVGNKADQQRHQHGDAHGRTGLSAGDAAYSEYGSKVTVARGT